MSSITPLGWNLKNSEIRPKQNLALFAQVHFDTFPSNEEQQKTNNQIQFARPNFVVVELKPWWSDNNDGVTLNVVPQFQPETPQFREPISFPLVNESSSPSPTSSSSSSSSSCLFCTSQSVGSPLLIFK